MQQAADFPYLPVLKPSTKENPTKFKLKNMIVQCLLGLAAVAVSSQATAQVTFYENSDFQGRSFSTGERVANFRDVGFNDRASSVIVLSRRWEVCVHAQFDGRCVVLRPGRSNQQQQHHQQQKQYQTQGVQRCVTVPSQARPELWDVSYTFRGIDHRLQMTTPPGPTVTVNRQGEPRA